MIRTGAASLIVGILFTVGIFFMFDKSSVFWFYLICLIFTSNLVGRLAAHWMHDITKKYLKNYRDLGTFWIENKHEFFTKPKTYLKFVYLTSRTFFLLDNWLTAVWLQLLQTAIPGRIDECLRSNNSRYVLFEPDFLFLPKQPQVRFPAGCLNNKL